MADDGGVLFPDNYFEILLRSQVSDLHAWRLVCKAWHRTITSPDFLLKHRRRHPVRLLPLVYVFIARGKKTDALPLADPNSTASARGALPCLAEPQTLARARRDALLGAAPRVLPLGSLGDTGADVLIGGVGNATQGSLLGGLGDTSLRDLQGGFGDTEPRELQDALTDATPLHARALLSGAAAHPLLAYLSHTMSSGDPVVRALLGDLQGGHVDAAARALLGGLGDAAPRDQVFRVAEDRAFLLAMLGGLGDAAARAFLLDGLRNTAARALVGGPVDAAQRALADAAPRQDIFVGLGDAMRRDLQGGHVDAAARALLGSLADAAPRDHGDLGVEDSAARALGGVADATPRAVLVELLQSADSDGGSTMPMEGNRRLALRIVAVDSRAGLSLPIIEFEGEDEVRIHGCLQGVMVVSYKDNLFAFRPATNSFIQLPPLHLDGIILGIFSEELEYKLLHCSGQKRYSYHCYSFRSKSSLHIDPCAESEEVRLLLQNGLHDCQLPPVLLKGSLHWLLLTGSESGKSILVWNINTRGFQLMPFGGSNSDCQSYQLVGFGEALRVVEVFDAEPVAVVWKLTDYEPVHWAKTTIQLPLETIFSFMNDGDDDNAEVYLISEEGDFLVECSDDLLHFDGEGSLLASYRGGKFSQHVFQSE